MGSRIQRGLEPLTPPHRAADVSEPEPQNYPFGPCSHDATREDTV